MGDSMDTGAPVRRVEPGELPREQKEMASHFTVDELPAREAAAFGNISKQIITHINRTADADAIDLLALLPELLLTDRALTRNGMDQRST